jgi:hypothetical protein
LPGRSIVPRRDPLDSEHAALGRGRAEASRLDPRMKTMKTLYVREGSEYYEAEATEIITRAQALIVQRYRTGSPALLNPTRTQDFLRLHLGAQDYEVFWLLHLDNQHRVIAVEDLFRGTLDGAHVYTREVVRSVIQHKSAEVILYHFVAGHKMKFMCPHSFCDAAVIQR